MSIENELDFELKSKRLMKLSSNVKKAISGILLSELREHISGYINLALLSITHVEINATMDNFKIGFLYPEEYKKDILILLNEVFNTKIKILLSKKIIFRRVPKISFVYDSYHYIRNA